jgi:hypothetical protein
VDERGLLGQEPASLDDEGALVADVTLPLGDEREIVADPTRTYDGARSPVADEHRLVDAKSTFGVLWYARVGPPLEPLDDAPHSGTLFFTTLSWQ